MRIHKIEAFEKVKKVIRSCKNMDHRHSAYKYFKLYRKMYNDHHWIYPVDDEFSVYLLEKLRKGE